MPLRAKPPEAVKKRLKLFMFGPAGVGKTTAAIQFPNAYIIDAERGTDQYDREITATGGVVFKTSDMREIVEDVKALLTTKHEYRTLVIDPITTAYNDLLEKCEEKVGSAHGRHYGEANKVMKRLANLILALDMNVVVTAHAKAEYGENLKKLGYTFDGWKQLDYWFDLVVELGKRGKKRMAKVVKTRIESFPDEDVFEWSYDAIRNRYDVDMLERESASVALASAEQVRAMKDLLNIVRLPDGTIDKWFAKAGVDLWEDMPADTMALCIDFVRSRLPTPPQRTLPAPPTPATPPQATPGELEQTLIRLDEMVLTSRKPAETNRYILDKEGVDSINQLSLDRANHWIAELQKKAAGKSREPATANT